MLNRRTLAAQTTSQRFQPVRQRLALNCREEKQTMLSGDTTMLREVSLFAALEEDELQVLAQQIELRRYLKGQVIFNTGDEGDALYIVRQGRVELYLQDTAGKHLVLQVVEQSGEMFGELSMLDREPRSASARALEDVELLVVDHADLEALFQKHPSTALDILAVLAGRLRATTLRFADASIRNPNQVTEQMEIRATLAERIAERLTEIASSIPFTYLNAALFAVWIGINLGAVPGLRPFDPFPFGLLTMAVSLEAIFLSLFVLISQNRQAMRDRVRNDIEYDVNVRAELEVRALAERLDAMEQDMLGHLARLS